MSNVILLSIKNEQKGEKMALKISAQQIFHVKQTLS
jgi:hypothetical protein